MKNLFILGALIMAFMLPCMSRAQSYRSIVVERHDGSEFVVQGEKGLSLAFTESELCFINGAGQRMTFPLSEVKGWHFSTKEGHNDWSGIDDLTATDVLTVSRNGDSVVIGNLPVDSRVFLATVAGKIVRTAMATGSHTIALDGLTPGLYLLVCNEITLKIVVD